MNSIAFTQVLAKLKNVRRSGDGYSALCPVHNDHHNSLSAKEGAGGRILLKCHAGCSFSRVEEALGVAISRNNIPTTNASNSRLATDVYPYRDEEGKLLYEVLRYDPKSFSQRRPDGKGGFISNVTGVRRVPYRLVDILSADPSQPIFIGEGERDADRLASLGLIATTNSGGAGKWRVEYNSVFKDRHVAILPDNDEVGARHAEQVARSLLAYALSVRIVKLPNLSHKGDVSDWLDSEGSKDKLLELVESARPYEDEAETFERTFLCWGDLMSLKTNDDAPIGFTLRRREVALLSAVTNRGKSTLLRNALLALACGRAFPPLVDKGEPRKVLLLDFETSIGRFKEDLQRMTADFSDDELRSLHENFFVMCDGRIDGHQVSLSRHQGQVEQYAKSKHIDVIAVDTLSSAFDLNDENNNADVTKRALRPLSELTKNVNAALIALHHIGKHGAESPNQSESAYRGRGASAFGCHATAVFNLQAEKEEENLVTLECAKRKDGGEHYKILLRLDPTSRWLQQVTNKVMPDRPTSEHVIFALLRSQSNQITRREIVEKLDGLVSRAFVDRWLRVALRKGLLTRSTRGCYSLQEQRNPESSQFLTPKDCENENSFRSKNN
jgi:hypothetical protein